MTFVQLLTNNIKFPTIAANWLDFITLIVESGVNQATRASIHTLTFRALHAEQPWRDFLAIAWVRFDPSSAISSHTIALHQI